LQFGPDRKAALVEMRRVLAMNGRIVVAVWGSDEGNEFLFGLRQVAENRVGRISDTRHSFSDAEALRSLLVESGFADVKVEAITRTVRFEDGETFVRMNAMAMVGMSAAGKEMSEQERAATVANIVADSAELRRANTDAAGLHYEIKSNIATARLSLTR
jgi:hypothetical protein